MFGLFRSSPVKKLKQQHEKLLTQDFEAQRNGDIRSYLTLTAQAEELRSKIESLENGEQG